MGIYVNKPMFDKHVDDSLLTGMAFWGGFLSGIYSGASTDQRVKDALHKVYGDVFENHGELNNTSRIEIKKALEESGVGVTEEGVDYLWDGYINSMV